MDTRFSLALLLEEPADLTGHSKLIEELGPDLGGLIIAAPEIVPLLDGTLPWPSPAARAVAALRARTGLPGALQAALLACSDPVLLALDAARPPPPVTLLRRLHLDPRAGNALVLDGDELSLPGRFRQGCLGPLSRALLEGERQLAVVLRRLHCSTLTYSAL